MTIDWDKLQEGIGNSVWREILEFEEHRHCTDCTLCESATNPGIPTRSLYPVQRTESDRAILFVGQSPGFNEDKKGECFIGYTGGLLKGFIEASGINKMGDVYLANALRCRPPQGANETQGQIRECRKHLQADIDLLYGKYKEVIIVALGAKACYSVAKISSLNEGLKAQGCQSTILDGGPRVFFTYHPAMLHQSRRPSLVRVVQDHFALLVRYLKGEFIPNALEVRNTIGCVVPKYLPDKVSCDIETYGILQGVEQTVFNPHKSFHVDKIPYDKQIVTVGFGWRDEEDVLRESTYRWDWPKHREYIRNWFERCVKSKITVIGQNLKFDLMYLSTNDRELRFWIDPSRLLIDDTLLLAFLWFEQRPEKGLKELAKLLGLYDYDALEVTGKHGAAKGPGDPKLHEYQAVDCAVTYLLYEMLENLIKDQYGSNSFKTGDACRFMREVVLWDTLDLDLNGSTFDVEKLKAIHKEEMVLRDELEAHAISDHEMKFCGTGSQVPLVEFVYKCAAEAGLLNDERLIFTDKTKEISIGVENVNLIKDYLASGSTRDLLLDFQKFKERHKIITTYTGPLLEKPQKGIVCRNGLKGQVYPSWYPIPMYVGGGGKDDKSGGQIQGRFSCKKPARMTEPAYVRKCHRSRFDGGRIIEFDVSQDHIRMAALLSGDPALMAVYQDPTRSLHSETAQDITGKKPEDFPSFEDWKASENYSLGKTLNFAVLFGCGGSTFQSTALHDAGLEIELDFANAAIRTWYEKYHVYRKWQLDTIRETERTGIIITPTGWSRTYGPPGSDLSAFHGEILNMWHQCPCAQMTQSAHWKVLQDFRKNYMRSMVCLQIYDALYIDTYPGEEETVDEIVLEAMTHPPLMPIFEAYTGRQIDWVVEKKEYGIC